MSKPFGYGLREKLLGLLGIVVVLRRAQRRCSPNWAGKQIVFDDPRAGATRS
jgi:hypothetical protein